MVLVLSHEECSLHLVPAGHPERAARLLAVERGFAALPAAWLQRRAAPIARREDVVLCHPGPYHDLLREQVLGAMPEALDSDTWLSRGSYQAAMRAVGGMIAAVDHVLAAGGAAFNATRPPGHHAERDKAMGFCLFGTAAIGVLHALERHGLQRVALLDFDVHHGNGSQNLLWQEPRVRFISSQQMPLYPGSGGAQERGAHGQITNLPLAPGSAGAEMRAVWAPALVDLALWQPQLIVISAGFDAHFADPLAGLNWSEADFSWLTEQICSLALRCCNGRVVSTLEGGYDLDALENCVASHVKELAGMEAKGQGR